jgi:hypothetical protein
MSSLLLHVLSIGHTASIMCWIGMKESSLFDGMAVLWPLLFRIWIDGKSHLISLR